MSLETHIAGVDDALISPLHFSGSPNTASYITERRNCTFAPQSGGLFAPDGIRLLRFNLADQSGFLDGQTLRLCFELKNSGTEGMTPIASSPACLFRRLRIIANGSAELEDIDEYGRTYEIFHTLLPAARRFNDITESWSAEQHEHDLTDHVRPLTLQVGQSRRLVVTLLSPFLSQGKLIPLNMIPVVLELEVGDVHYAFAGTDAAMKWEIYRPRLIADVLSLENSLQNSYAKLLLDGRSLPMPVHGIYSIKAAITDGSYFSLPITRGFTRLSTIYFTFIDDGTKKECTNFVHPALNGADPNVDADPFEWWVTVGADRYPQFNVDSCQEAFYRLRLANLVHTGTDSLSMSSHEYRFNKFIGALNLEKAPGSAGHSGINTRGGSQLTLHFKNVGSTAKYVHVILHADQVVSASAAGVEVLD